MIQHPYLIVNVYLGKRLLYNLAMFTERVNKMPLTRVQITQRNRERKKVIKEELAKCNITERKFYVDDKLYEHFNLIAERYATDIHGLLFIAMRKFINDADPSLEIEEHMFLLELAMLNVFTRLDSSPNLGAPRETKKYIKDNGE